MRFRRSRQEKRQKEIGDFIESLTNEDPSLREAAIGGLAKIGKPAIPALIEVLRDETGEIAQREVLNLVSMGPDALFSRALAALRNECYGVQEAATLALIRIGEPAVDSLIDLLRHSDAKVRMHAAYALGEIGSRRAIRPLEELLRPGSRPLEANSVMELAMEERYIRQALADLRGTMYRNDTAQWFEKGNDLLTSEEYEDAIATYNKVLDANPRHVGAWNNKGFALKELGRHQEAIACFDKALEMQPQNGEAWRDKAVSLCELGRYEESITCFNQALLIDPTSPSSWLNKGNALMQLGRYQDAIEAFQNFLQHASPKFAYFAEQVRNTVLPELYKIRNRG